MHGSCTMHTQRLTTKTIIFTLLFRLPLLLLLNSKIYNQLALCLCRAFEISISFPVYRKAVKKNERTSVAQHFGAVDFKWSLCFVCTHKQTHSHM